jgi:hypothetical protein
VSTATAGSSAAAAIPAFARDPKKAARLARHAKFVSRIEKKSASASGSTRRRRPSKKLVSTLDSLADALPDINASAGDRAQLEDVLGRNKKGLKSRPGAMKRKETLLKSECERFGKNLAILETGGGEKSESGSPWVKLRGFIGATLERKEEFVEMEKTKEGTMEAEA